VKFEVARVQTIARLAKTAQGANTAQNKVELVEFVKLP
jgi:hypothetical protein